MSRFDETEDPRRRLLLQALAAGLFTTATPVGVVEASLFGDVPRKLPPGRSIYKLEGRVLVNGRIAYLETPIGPNDTIETEGNGNIVFVVGQDAYILRGGSKLVLSGRTQSRGAVDTLKLFAGKLLSAFGKSRHQLATPTSTVGIRGTGIYVEADPQETYFCTCYGTVDLSSVSDPKSRETVISTHHQARYIVAGASAGRNIRPAPFKNHTDMELMLIEELVGRTPPFVFPAEEYNTPRREY